MTALQKAKSPVGAGQIAEETRGSASVVPTADYCKTIEAQTIAAMQLRGFAVHESGDGYLVCRWAFSRHLPDLRSLVEFARQTGGGK